MLPLDVYLMCLLLTLAAFYRFYSCLTVCPSFSLASTLKKLDPEDGEQILDYFQTHALLARDKACGSQCLSQ